MEEVDRTGQDIPVQTALRCYTASEQLLGNSSSALPFILWCVFLRVSMHRTEFLFLQSQQGSSPSCLMLWKHKFIYRLKSQPGANVEVCMNDYMRTKDQVQAKVPDHVRHFVSHLTS